MSVMRGRSSTVDVSAVRAAFAAIALCVGIGGLLGLATNAFNGWLSPDYFRSVFRGWRDWPDDVVWRAAVVQGVMEGLLYGVFFAVVVLINVSAATTLRLRIRPMTRYLLLAGVVVLICWGIGGGIAIALVAVSPEWYTTRVANVPAETGPMLAHAWVGGSIYGAIAGGFFGVVTAIALMWRNRRLITVPQGQAPARA